MMRRSAAVVPLLALVLAFHSEAQVVLTVKESAINKLADRIGPISDSGSHDVYIPFTCFECAERVAGVCVWWNASSCQIKIFSANWNWSVKDFRFSIKPSGISYVGSLSAKYGALPTYTTSVYGTASVTAAANSISLSMTRVTIPIRFDVPFAGTVTVTNINRALPYSQSVRLYELPLRQDPPEGRQWATLYLRNLQREYATDELRIKATLASTGGS